MAHLLHDTRRQVGGGLGSRAVHGCLQRQKVFIDALTVRAGVQMCAQRLLLCLRQLAVKQLTDLQPVMLTGVHTSAPPFVCFDA